MFELPLTGQERYHLQHDIGFHIMQVHLSANTVIFYRQIYEHILTQEHFSVVEVYALWQACRAGVLRRALWDCFARLSGEYK